VVLAEDFPDAAADAYPVAFANLRVGYPVIDRHGVRLLQDPYTDKPNVRFYTYARVGGIKLLKIATW
jgi:HK97 family phage major capsid protein